MPALIALLKSKAGMLVGGAVAVQGAAVVSLTVYHAVHESQGGPEQTVAVERWVEEVGADARAEIRTMETADRQRVVGTPTQRGGWEGDEAEGEDEDEESEDEEQSEETEDSEEPSDDKAEDMEDVTEGSEDKKGTQETSVKVEGVATIEIPPEQLDRSGYRAEF